MQICGFGVPKLSTLNAGLFVLALLLSSAPNALAESPRDLQLHLPNRAPVAARSAEQPYQPDVLLIMPSQGADQGEIKEALTEAHGQVIDTIGSGDLTVYVVKCEKGKFVETEKKLKQDSEHFSSVERNVRFTANVVSSTNTPNDPYYPQEWHLQALKATQVWSLTAGQTAERIAIADTGCNSISDLNGRLYQGYDVTKGVQSQSDTIGHGTMVASTTAALNNNGIGTASLIARTGLLPVKIADAGGNISLDAILKAISYAGANGFKIVNISANASPPNTLAAMATSSTSIVRKYLKDYHDSKGGLVFNSAGNSGTFDQAPKNPYLIVVSAIEESGNLASFSTYGNSVWFTCPGVNIVCSNNKGQVVSVAGTSFSSPLCASVAAVLWGAYPQLTNKGIEDLMSKNCIQAGNAAWNNAFGYGLPNAAQALGSSGQSSSTPKTPPKTGWRSRRE